MILRQLLPGAADEWNPLEIFIVPRRLPDEHQLGLRVPDAEDDVVAAGLVQLAAHAVADLRANPGQQLRGRRAARRAVRRAVRRARRNRRHGVLVNGSAGVGRGLGRPRRPRGVAAEPGDAELLEELQVPGQLVLSVHGRASQRDAGACARSSASTRSRIASATAGLGAERQRAPRLRR